MTRITKHYSTVASTVALVIALTGAGAYAAHHLHLISSKQIRNGTIRTVDLHRRAVTPAKANFPPPRQLSTQTRRHLSQTVNAGDDFAQVADLGSYTKLDAASTLQVTWTGSAQAGFLPCVFQLRVDGQPPPDGGAEVYIANGTTLSVADQGLFAGLDAGAHEVTVWAHTVNSGGGSYPCTVAPDNTVPQTVNAAELVQ